MTYASMEAGDMLAVLNDDARKWADAFCEIHPGNDHETMVGWFANAIEHSTDYRIGQIARSDEALADHMEAVGRRRAQYRELGLSYMRDAEASAGRESQEALGEALEKPEIDIGPVLIRNGIADGMIWIGRTGEGRAEGGDFPIRDVGALLLDYYDANF